MIERKILTFNIQKYNIHDGPGVRTLVFFKGCPLRCTWCSNPEGQSFSCDILFKQDVCVNCGACVQVCPVQLHAIQGTKHILDRSKECIGCRECEKVCPVNALAVVGEEKSISELLALVEEDRTFYEVSGGGLTLGGGEVLSQHEGALNLLMTCKQHNFHTAIETCGYTKKEKLKEIAEAVDLFLYDIKHMDSEAHYKLTGVRNEIILKNLIWLLENRYNVHIRLPLLKGINDDVENMLALVNFLLPYKDLANFKGVDILPYHKLGVHKYAQLNKEYQLNNKYNSSDTYALQEEDLERLKRYFEQSGIPVNIILH